MSLLGNLHEKHRNSLLLPNMAMKCIGINLFEDPQNKIANFVKFTIYVLANLIYMSGVTYYVIFDREGGGFYLALVEFTIFAQSIPKHYILIGKTETIRNLVRAMDNLWPKNIQENGDLTKIKSHLRRAELLFKTSYYYTAVAFLTVEIGGFFAAIIMKQRDPEQMYRLPGEFSYPDKTDRFEVFVPVYLVQALSISLFGVCVYMGFSCLLGIMVSNVSLLFRVVCLRLEKSIKEKISDPQTVNSDVEDDQECFQEICKIIKYHQDVLNVADEVKELFSFAIFIDVSLASVVIGFYGFITVTADSFRDQAKNALPMLTLLWDIMLLAWPGQLLADTSESVAEAAYNCKWYKSDLKIRKLIYIIMMRSQNPVHLSAYGFTDMTINTFAKIISTAWSYISLLTRVLDK